MKKSKFQNEIKKMLNGIAIQYYALKRISTSKKSDTRAVAARDMLSRTVRGCGGGEGVGSKIGVAQVEGGAGTYSRSWGSSARVHDYGTDKPGRRFGNTSTPVHKYTIPVLQHLMAL